MSRKSKRMNIGNALFDTFNYSFMIILSFVFIFPFWDTLVLSFADVNTVNSLGHKLWPSEIHFDAYSYLFNSNNILLAYFNTVFRTVVGTFGSLVIVVLAAYPLSKKNLPGRNWITIFFLFTMFFSGGLIPYYLVIKGIGLIDTIWVFIVPGLMGVFHMILVRNFMMAMDIALEEAALIDGANFIQILWRVIVPLNKPVLATIGLWIAVGHWNAWFDALIFTRSDSLIVLQLLVRKMVTVLTASDLTDFNRMNEIQIHSASVSAAAIIVTIGPIIFAYPFLQKYFVKGIMIGSLKG